MDIYKLRKILQRYQEGKANETENALIEAWYKSYEQQEHPVSEDELNSAREAISRGVKAITVKRSIFYLPVFGIAASLAVFLIIGFIAWRTLRERAPKQETYTVISTGTKDLKQLTLPDGSTIWINAASRLKVPEVFTGQFREVILEEGEAFFDIKHDLKHPFIVHTSALNVQVLGTSFNVRAYKDLNSINVSVVTGKVGIIGKSKTLAMLLPGQQLDYNILNGTTEQKTVDLDRAQSWKKGYTYLDQAGFKELATVVKNIYGLSIIAGNKKVASYRFTLRLVHSMPTDQLIILISRLHHTHFRKEGNDIILF